MLKFVIIIQPEWEIDDIKIIFLVELIEMRDKVPTVIESIKNLDRLVIWLILMNMEIGIVFCQDRKIIRGFMASEFPIFKIHRCNGNNPIFREMAKRRIKENFHFLSMK